MCIRDRSELFRVSSTVEERYANARIKPGDILITIVGASTGRIAVVPAWLNGANLTQTTARIAIAEECAGGRYCGHVLSSWYGTRQVQNYIKGGAQPGLNCGDVERFWIPLPPTKSEQEAIAEALSDADALIESLKQLLAKKRHLKLGAMQELLTGRRRLPTFESKHGHKQTEAGMIPEDWVLRPMLSVVRVASGQVDPKVEPYRAMTLVAPDHIESGTGRLLQKETAAEQQAISGKYIFEKGDVVYSKIRPYLRKAILADFDGLCSADMYPLRPAPNVSGGFVLASMLGLSLIHI